MLFLVLVLLGLAPLVGTSIGSSPPASGEPPATTEPAAAIPTQTPLVLAANPTATLAPTQAAAGPSEITGTDAPSSSTDIPSTAPAVVQAKIAPPAGYYWGALVDGVPFEMSKLTAFEDATGRKVDVVHWGQPWTDTGQAQAFPAGVMDRVWQHGSIPLLDWGSADPAKGLDQPDFRLAQIYQGKYDSYIRTWANAAKAWGNPFFLRFDHEMNGWWFSWDEQLNGNQPGDFVKAWRHVHDIFTQVGATNVTWVWCPNIIGNSKLTPLFELYPGANYVDWVGMDGFNWGSDSGAYWQTFDQVFADTYERFHTLAPGTPIMIAEVASSEKGGPLGMPASKAAWIRDAFTNQLPSNFPEVKAVVWFNSVGEDPTRSWPLQSSSASLQAIKDVLGALPQASR